MADMKVLRTQVSEMASQLFEVIGIPFDETTELQRQLLATFSFGMVFVVGRIQGLTPPQVHALAILCLTDVFKYSNDQAGSFSQHLISVSSDKSIHPTMNTIVHRGIDGHKQWSEGKIDLLRINIEEVFQAVEAPPKGQR